METSNKRLVLDCGYVGLVETWGSDEAIIEAARMSTGKGFLGWGPRHAHECPNRFVQCEEGKCELCGMPPGDEKLLRHLWKNKHATPFEMGGLVIEVQAPIFVIREWHRHRTQGYSEMSARYTPLPDFNYVPTVERLMLGGGSNRQATGTGAELTEAAAELFRMALTSEYANQERTYQNALLAGVPKELARLVLPVGRYTRMRATANLRNWLGFLTLRMDVAAQWEIRQYANEVGALVEKHFPRTWHLFNEERLEQARARVAKL